ncbi:MAG: hypothetical protein ACRCZS_02285 [Chroococcidiopsis sp.]
MNNILIALNSAVELAYAQQAEIQSLNQSNQQLANEIAAYKQLDADAQASIDRLNALLPSPPAVPSGESPAPDLQAETVTVEPVAVIEEKQPDWAVAPDPALVPTQIDSPVVGM